MIVVGTAGHIDHGKSAIVKRLTGRDPDRLPEEKSRGMTIDLGFAFMPSDSGEEIAFIDVPGHERFVKNMISGAGGIDLVMLVIAADDGWMPQSEEHFQIIRLLGVKRGLIVINKTDLVDEDWLKLLEEEIRAKIAGSFLGNAPIFKVSAQSGAGFESLSAHLRKLSSVDKSHRDIGKARLYVDRAFMRTGIGRVVAGTLRGGELRVGQEINIFPAKERAKIRSLQSNGQEVASATPGQRTAVTISGVDKEELQRGAVVTDQSLDSYRVHNVVFAMSVELLSNSPVPLKDRRRALVILGTTEVEGEIRIHETKEIAPGQSGIIYFRPDEPLFGFVGDHFVVRLPTPMVTLGGGELLDHLSDFPRRREMVRFAYLESRRNGSVREMVETELEAQLIATLPLLRFSDFSEAEIRKAANQLLMAEIIGKLGEKLYHAGAVETLSALIIDTITSELKQRPHIKGLPPAEVARLVKRPPAVVEDVLEILVGQARMMKSGDKYNLIGRGASVSGDIKQAYEEIMKELTAGGYSPPRLPDMAKQGKAYREAIRFILESEQGYKCGSEFVFLTEIWNEIVSFIKETIRENSGLAVTDLRDKFEFSRKYAIPILEETDRLKITERDGDRRVKGKKFESA